ncbi:MAG: PEP-CTERM sorting domain-containing protein [Phycisphaerales bacterium]
MLGNWNAGTPPADIAALIPEPGTGTLLILGVLAACVRVKRNGYSD